MMRAKESLAEEDGVLLGHAWRSILLFALWMDLRACANFRSQQLDEAGNNANKVFGIGIWNRKKKIRLVWKKKLIKRGFMCHGWCSFSYQKCFSSQKGSTRSTISKTKYGVGWYYSEDIDAKSIQYSNIIEKRKVGSRWKLN